MVVRGPLDRRGRPQRGRLQIASMWSPPDCVDVVALQPPSWS